MISKVIRLFLLTFLVSVVLLSPALSQTLQNTACSQDCNSQLAFIQKRELVLYELPKTWAELVNAQKNPMNLYSNYNCQGGTSAPASSPVAGLCPFALKPSEQRVFDFGAGTLIVAVGTDNNFMKRILRGGWRYVVVWDTQQKAYDIKQWME